MSAVTGLGPVETMVLGSYGSAGALSGHPYVKNQRILDLLDREFQVAPVFGYQLICDFARPYISHLRLVDFHGNYGSQDFPEALARYTQSRLSTLGEIALRAEQGTRPAIPIRLINGTTYLDGHRPPLYGRRVVAALLAADRGASDAELIETVGLPMFATGCHVFADKDQFVAGTTTQLRLQAHIEQTAPDELTISRLPPGSSVDDILTMIDQQVSRSSRAGSSLRIADVNDWSSGGKARITVRLSAGADQRKTVDQLAEIWGIYTTMLVALGLPLPEVLRTLIAEHGTTELGQQLQPILDLLHS